jgi:hypothetical protein
MPLRPRAEFESEHTISVDRAGPTIGPNDTPSQQVTVDRIIVQFLRILRGSDGVSRSKKVATGAQLSKANPRQGHTSSRELGSSVPCLRLLLKSDK